MVPSQAEVAMGQDIIVMKQKELLRLHVIRQRLKRQIKQTEAAELMGLGTRQVRRITQRVMREGDVGIVHRLRGRESHKRIRAEIRKRVLELCRTVYKGFGPVFASEKLAERDGIKISDETLRKWLHAEGLMEKARKRRRHRQWRERKKHCGEMVQMDGSHHAWFEERGPACVLMGYIDDATGKKYGRFYEYEGTMPALDSLKRYIRQNGVPGTVYVDRHSTYKSMRAATVEEQLENRRAASEFEKAVGRIGIRVIHAQSAPAKGRIERSFRTDQDRLVKELRLRNVSTIGEANRFLEQYWSRHNRRFSIAPVEPDDFHRPVTADVDLDALLSVRTERSVRKDGTIAYGGQWYQLLERNGGRTVAVEEQTQGRILIRSGEKSVPFKALESRPKAKGKRTLTQSRREIPHPSQVHPWKGARFGRRFPKTVLREKNRTFLLW